MAEVGMAHASSPAPAFWEKASLACGFSREGSAGPSRAGRHARTPSPTAALGVGQGSPSRRVEDTQPRGGRGLTQFHGV